MLLEEIINPDAVLCNAQARSKKHCLEILSELLVRSQPDIAADDIFERLIERERLGCTSLEAGVAFPHCRVEGIDRCIAAMIKLSDPIDFDATDGEPVDLVFGLMVPREVTDMHHADIAMITNLLGNGELRSKLREATSSSALYNTLLDGTRASVPDRLQTAHGN
ncbi:MAG: PTS sugar transporter subunit IIA [Gammaproteobacteria bacterium]|jgi:PTS system nitrogen regulatory IIA component|nr:PTS sugar transporter subunit IIA [Gammaproteobacteria bacterium]MDH3758497.1 PTS sugar transporter subunit IIA [Gammaproteobacteria bacterium]MDH3847774.1 PTS sugar transporter subunit IIA [Gammaproteobacteria bacterium]MDH3863456.1 PTS sugar transporter subunit IIA [Gammaproteobacteria bacterium]MDH3904911.1 PTS sugar transporter subunit IIA [Gammaproteobacteria bacterium]